MRRREFENNMEAVRKKAGASGVLARLPNIGMRVTGVSALAGFVEPDFKNDPPYDQPESDGLQ